MSKILIIGKDYNNLLEELTLNCKPIIFNNFVLENQVQLKKIINERVTLIRAGKIMELPIIDIVFKNFNMEQSKNDLICLLILNGRSYRFRTIFIMDNFFLLPPLLRPNFETIYIINTNLNLEEQIKIKKYIDDYIEKPFTKIIEINNKSS